MTGTPTVAIIGAGISGLTSLKILLDYGVEVTCFESGDRIGGNWAFQNPNGHSSAYRSLHIDTSKDLLSFEDLPMPESFPDFPHHSDIKAYLDQYAETFGLLDHIRFETPVEHAERLPGGGWRLTLPTGEELFDVLVVANGHHWDPRLPDFPGEFAGEAIHSHHYVSPTEPLDLRGKRILVVGIGNSAADIVSELSQRSHGNEVVLSTRSGAWVMPKYLFGMPIDRVARTLPVIPPALQRRLVRGLPRLVSGKPEAYGLPRPDHHFLEAHPTVSSELLLRLGSGDAVAKPNVERLDGHTVHFVDGTSQDFDAIVYATGYNISFPFFDRDLLSAPDNQLPLYKRILDPRFDDLVMIGFAQALPTLFPFVENQTRLLAAYVTGSYRPPSPDEMRAAIEADQRRWSGHYADRPRHTQQVDYFLYVDEMHRKELPAGRRRAQELGPVPLAGRAAQALQPA
jgi:cation diffusion facilitator CzcD-associated flavoprotein CzcO